MRSLAKAIEKCSKLIQDALAKNKGRLIKVSLSKPHPPLLKWR
jgi:hypothetical protein